MSDFTIEQLEHFKKVMEPTPPFLEALIAEKRAHQKLRAEVERLRDNYRTRPYPYGEAARDLTRILGATDD